MELIISGPPRSGKTSAALEIAHAVYDGLIKSLKPKGYGGVVFISKDDVASKVLSLEKSLGLAGDALHFHSWDGSIGGMVQAIHFCKEVSPSLVVLDQVPVDYMPFAPNGEGVAPCANALRDAARSEGWSLVICRVTQKHRDQANQVRHALCEKGFHESVRDDEVGIKVYDIEDAKISPELPRLEPGQIALEFPETEDYYGGTVVYDIGTLLRSLEFVTPGSYSGWNDEDPDQVDWGSLRHDLEPAQVQADSSVQP